MIKFGTGGFRGIIGDEFTKKNITRVIAALCAVAKADGKTDKSVAVATVSGGFVEAKGEGLATITATVKDKSAECSVTVVDTGAVPTIVVDVEPRTIFEDAQYQINASVVYKNNDVDVTLLYESDSDVATVNAQGLVTAAEYAPDNNTANITISGTWKGYTLTQKTIEVSVAEDVSISLDKSFVLLAASVPANSEHINETEITSTLLIKNVVSNNLVSVTNSHPEVAEYNSTTGKIIAKGKGISRISFSYTAAKGTVVDAYVDVEVYLPLIDLSDAYLADISKTAETQIMLSDINLAISASENSAIDSADINSIYLSSSKIEEPNFTLDSNILSLVALGADSSLKGDDYLEIETSTATYKFKVLLVMKKLANAQDLTDFFDDFLAQAGSTTTWVNAWAGEYFILTNDIDASAYFHKDQDGVAFSGTFDGRGFAIKNLTLGAAGTTSGLQRGFIRDVQADATIRNLALINVTNMSAASNGSILSTNARGTFENCYVQGRYTAAVTDNTHGAGGLLATTYDTTKISNCIVAVEFEPAVTSTATGIIASTTRHSMKASQMVNTYGISSSSTRLAQGFTSNEVNAYFADEYAFGAAVTELSSSDGWSKYWNIQNNKLYFGANEMLSWAEANCTQTVLKDLSKNDDIEITLAEINSVIQEAGRNAIALSDIKGINLNSVALDQTQHTIGTSSIGIKALGMGFVGGNEASFEIVTNQITYKFKVNVVYKTISNNDDFTDFYTLYKGLSGTGNKLAGETIVLLADLDLTDWVQPEMPDNANYLFVGTFDGRGHSLTNFKTGFSTGNRGLFRNVENGGLIQNLALINCELGDVAESSAIAYQCHGEVRNCFISGVNKFEGAAVGSTQVGNSGGIITYVGGATKVHNNIVVMEVLDAVNRTLIDNDGRNSNRGASLLKDNYGISQTCTSMVKYSFNTTNISNNVLFTNAVDFAAAADLTTWDDIWEIKQDGLYFNQAKVLSWTIQ